MQETFETSDIFRSAYLLCQGCELDEIAVEVNGRPTAVFRIVGDDVSRLDLDYRNGEALVNPLQFRETLNLLRDLMFKKIRRFETRESPPNKRAGKEENYVHSHS